MIGKQTVVYLYNEVLLGNKKEINDTCYNVYETENTVLNESLANCQRPA